VVACPTGSIGTLSKHDLAPAIESFPMPIDAREDTGIYHLGFHSRDSFGAASYLIVRGDGRNVMVDSPRFNKGLVERIKALGGVHTMFLTHRDDVADHDRYAEALGATRVMHKRDLRPHTRSVENLIEITEPTPLDDELLMIPVPGHTQGSMCLLVQGPLPVQRRPPGVGHHPQAPVQLPAGVLVRLGPADRVHRGAARAQLRVGAAGARAAREGQRGGHAAGARGLHRVDAQGRVTWSAR
jgi:hypothetical protein